MAHIPKPNNLDSIRLIAALMVVYAHCIVPFPGLQDPFIQHLQIYSMGRVAVMVFFVISGYLITQSWLSHPNLVDYARNRLLRLVPALAVVVALTALVMGPLVTTLPLEAYFADPLVTSYFKNILLYPMSDSLPGVFDRDGLLWRGAVNGSLWTLRIEFTMYLLVAALGVLRLLKWPIMLASLIGFVCLYVLYYTHPVGSIPKLFWYMEVREIGRFGMCFAVGSLVCLRDARWFYSTPMVIASVVAMIGAGWFNLTQEPFMYWTVPAIVLWLGFHPRLRLPNLARSGDMSYGVYIYAYPLQQLYLWSVGAEYGFGWFLVYSILASLLCGALSWHLVEKHALRFKRR